MLPGSPRSRLSSSPIRTVLGVAAAALIGTAVGGVSVLSIVIAMTAPSHDVPSSASKDGAGAAAPKPVVVATPQPQPTQSVPTEQAPAEQATAPPGQAKPSSQGKPASAEPQDTRPEAPSRNAAQPAPAAAQNGNQMPAAAPPLPSVNQQVGANGGDNRQDSRRGHSPRSKRFTVTRDDPTGGGANRDVAGSNGATDTASASHRPGPSQPLLDSYGGHSRDDRGDGRDTGGRYGGDRYGNDRYGGDRNRDRTDDRDVADRYRGDRNRDDRYPDAAGPPPRSVIVIPDRGYDGPDRSGGWGGFFGGGHWGGNDW